MIKADGPAKVKVIAILLAAFAIVAPRAQADVSEKDVRNVEQQEFGIDNSEQLEQKGVKPEAPVAPADVQPEASPEKINPIEAEEFKVRGTKKSRSGRVILFDDATDNKPRPGKVLLLKAGDEEISAIRVLKNYPGKFAAKVILPFKETQLDTEYRALKKLGDKIIALIKEREKGKDLDAMKTDEDLAKEVDPDDNELDRGIPSPAPNSKKKVKKTAAPKDPNKPQPLWDKDGNELSPDNIEVKDEDEPYADLSVQEDLPLEPLRHAITAQYAQIRNVDNGNNAAQYSGFGIRYAFNFARMVLLHRRTLQDMLSLEASAFYYSISGFNVSTDSYTVIPIIGTLRYNLLVGENLDFFLYGGLLKNNVSQSGATDNSGTVLLGTTKAALGGGAMVKIGPAWAIRLDFGTDLFGVGAVLKF
jgi:hypothetical protein